MESSIQIHNKCKVAASNPKKMNKRILDHMYHTLIGMSLKTAFLRTRLKYMEQIQKNIVQELSSEIAEPIKEPYLIKLYNKSISLFQSNKCTNGTVLEQFVESVLKEHNIEYRKQMKMNKNGILSASADDIHHVVDFVIGDVSETDVRKLVVLSCKTTCRERWTQDAWSLTIKPKRYILMTSGKDYPGSKRFQESSTRKIIALEPKQKDDRVYKLSFDDFLDTVMM